MKISIAYYYKIANFTKNKVVKINPITPTQGRPGVRGLWFAKKRTMGGSTPLKIK